MDVAKRSIVELGSGPSTDGVRADDHGAARPRRHGAVASARYLTLYVDLFVVIGLSIAVAIGPGLDVTSVVLLGFVGLATVFCSDPTSSRLTLSVLDEVPRLAGWVGVCLLLAAPVAVHQRAASRAMTEAGVALGLLILGRASAYALVRRARRRRTVADRAVIIGAGAVGVEVARAFRTHPEFGVEVVGFVDKPGVGDPPVLGDVDDIQAIADRTGARRVIVAYGLHREHELVDLLRRLALLELDVHLVPRFFDVGVGRVGPKVDDVWGIPLYRLPAAGSRRPAWVAKRVVDVAASSICLVVALPVLAVLAVTVRLGSPGRALFRQARSGREGRSFHLLKLRSLREETDTVPVTQLVEMTDQLGGDQSDLEVQALRNLDVDTRLTGVGEFIRRTSLDEVPQFWNVLVGDMSLVGPRPEELEFAERFTETIPGYRDRHRIAGGLTGWAQVNGLRGPTSIAERARFDNYYIENWSMWRDLSIVVRTTSAMARSILNRRNAVAPNEAG